MAVRRKKVEDSGASSLDSLMDALTNVVAVLIFVLLLVNCDVAQTVVKMMDDLIPASEEDIQKLKEQLKKMEVDKNKLEELKKTPPPPQVDIDALNSKISNLQNLVRNKAALNELHAKNLAELQKLHDEALAERDAVKKESQDMMAEVDRLLALLDTTPVLEDIPATDITIPATRPIPEGAKIYWAYVLNNRVHLLDQESLFEDAKKIADDLQKDKNNLFNEEEKEEESDKKLTAAERRAAREKARAEAKKDKKIVFNRDKLQPALEQKLKITTPGQKLTMTFNAWDAAPRIQVQFSSNEGGATEAELKQPTNAFATSLSKVRPPNEVVFFKVDPKSMLTYALAREIVEKRGIPCGWEMIEPSSFTFSRTLPDIAMNITGKAPEKPPGWKPPPPGMPGMNKKTEDLKLD